MANTENEVQDLPRNPVEPSTKLKPGLTSEAVTKTIHPQQTQYEVDSAVTKAEKTERHGDMQNGDDPPNKRMRLDPSASSESQDHAPTRSERRKGVAPIKAELVSLR